MLRTVAVDNDVAVNVIFNGPPMPQTGSQAEWQVAFLESQLAFLGSFLASELGSDTYTGPAEVVPAAGLVGGMTNTTSGSKRKRNKTRIFEPPGTRHSDVLSQADKDN